MSGTKKKTHNKTQKEQLTTDPEENEDKYCVFVTVSFLDNGIGIEKKKKSLSCIKTQQPSPECTKRQLQER